MSDDKLNIYKEATASNWTLQKSIESTKREWSPKERIPSNDHLFTSVCDEMWKD